MQPLERVADCVARDDAAFGHHRLGRAQPALPVLEVDERRIRAYAPRFGAVARAMVRDHGLDEIGQQREGIVPVAPASRSAINVIDSSPSNGPAIVWPPASIRLRNLPAAPCTSILK
jgi:hypothetical protein